MMDEHIKKINSCISEFFNKYSGKSASESFKDFNEILQNTESIVSGGFIVSCLTDYDITQGDIDIYVNRKNSMKLIELLIQTNFGYKIQDSHIAPAYDQSFFRKNNIMARIPFVNITGKKNIIDVMVIPDNIDVRTVASNFDLTFCEVWWDGKELGGTNIEDTLNKRGFLRKDYEKYLVEHFNPFILKRIQKYNSRGFDIKYESKCNISNSLIDYGNSNKSVESGEKWLVSYLYKLLLNLKMSEVKNNKEIKIKYGVDLQLYYSIFWMLSKSSDNMMNDYTMDELKKVIDNNNLIQKSDRFFSYLLSDDNVELEHVEKIPKDSYNKVILLLLCLYDDFLVETISTYTVYGKAVFDVLGKDIDFLIGELKTYTQMNQEVLFDDMDNRIDSILEIKEILERKLTYNMFRYTKPCNLKTIQINNIESIEEQCKNINQSTNTHLDTSLNFIIVTDDDEFFCVNSKEILQNILNNKYKIYNLKPQYRVINIESIFSNTQSNIVSVPLCEIKTLFHLVENNLQICYLKKNSEYDIYNFMICDGSNCKNTKAVDLLNDYAPILQPSQLNNPPQVRLSRRVTAGSLVDTQEPVVRSLDFDDDDSDDEDTVVRSLDFDDSDDSDDSDDVDVIIDTNITSEDLNLTLTNDGRWELLTLKDDSFVLKGQDVVVEGQYTDFIFYKFGSDNVVGIDSIEDDDQKFKITLENENDRDKIMYKVYKLNEPFYFTLFKNPGDYDDTILFRQAKFNGKIVPVFITYSKEQDPYTDGDYNFVYDIVSEGGDLDITYDDNVLLMTNDEYDFDFVLVDELSKYDLHRIINFVKYYSQ